MEPESIFFCLIVLSNVVTLQGSFGYSPAIPFHSSQFSTPEIRVSKWISTSDASDIDFDDKDETWEGTLWNSEVDTNAVHISGYGSHEYLISQHVAAIRMECRAQYPVEWVFHNALYVTEALHGIQIKTFRQSKSVLDPKSDTFSSSLEIKMDSNKVTGNYSCSGVSPESRHLTNNIFIYWEGNSPPYLILSGKMLEVGVDPSKLDSVTIPCYVSSPNVGVRLFKEIKGEFKEVSPVRDRMSYIFSPKIGFQLSSENITDVQGRYRCYAGDKEDNDMMEVRIKPNSKGTTTTSICEGNACFKRVLSPGTRFYFDPNTEELICCGRRGSTKPTNLHVIFCSSPSICQMYEPALYLASGNNGRRSMNGSCIAEKLYPRDFGIAKCKGDGIDVFTYVYTEFWTTEQENLRAVFNWQDLNPSNALHVMIHASLPLYNRQLVTATCQTLHSYFSDGIKWAIKWRNGSLSYFDSLVSAETNPRLHGIRSSYLRLSVFMSELICFAPVWNSTKWIEKSIRLEVKPSRSPKIVGETVEERTFGLNETDKILECTSTGQPLAKIKWTRNGEEIPRNMIIWNANGTSILMLKTISFKTNGEYICLAMNEVGQATKTFKIFVEDMRHSSWSTAFAVVIPILVIVSIGTVAYLVWRLQLQRKVVDHLTRVVFRETGN